MNSRISICIVDIMFVKVKQTRYSKAYRNDFLQLSEIYSKIVLFNASKAKFNMFMCRFEYKMNLFEMNIELVREIQCTTHTQMKIANKPYM